MILGHVGKVNFLPVLGDHSVSCPKIVDLLEPFAAQSLIAEESVYVMMAEDLRCESCRM